MAFNTLYTVDSSTDHAFFDTLKLAIRTAAAVEASLITAHTTNKIQEWHNRGIFYRASTGFLFRPPETFEQVATGKRQHDTSKDSWGIHHKDMQAIYALKNELFEWYPSTRNEFLSLITRCDNAFKQVHLDSEDNSLYLMAKRITRKYNEDGTIKNGAIIVN